MKRASVRACRDLLIGALRLTERNLFGETHDAVELGVVLFQSRDVELGELRGLHLPALDEPR